VCLACVTNKNAQFTMPLLRSIGLLADFAIIVSGDTVPVKKPDPAPLLYAMEQAAVTPAQCLMVGDSANDIGAANAAGIPCLAVSYGYHRGRDLWAEGAILVVDSLAEIIPLMEETA
jgi:phosphoglycolate phosphatase